MTRLYVFLFALLMATSVQAETLVSRESKFSVKETIDRLVAELDKRGLKIAARIDHAAGAQSAGIEMPPTEVIIFGNPKLGTPLMLAAPSIAIDLPLRMVAWQDKSGKVLVGYVAPETLKARHSVVGRDEAFGKMAGALDGLVKAAAGQ